MIGIKGKEMYAYIQIVHVYKIKQTTLIDVRCYVHVAMYMFLKLKNN